MAIRREYPAHPILGAAGIVIRGQSVVLVERGREPLKGQWSIPGGAVETGEALDTALRREMLEETGLTVEPLELVTVFERITSGPDGGTRYHYVILDYLCRHVAGELRAGDDAPAARWIRRDELGGLPLTEGALTVLEKAFRMAAAHGL